MIAIIGGEPARFRPLVELYREAARRSGREPAELAVGINTHGFIAENAKQAADDYFPYYSAVMTQIGRERGWPPMTRQQFDALCTLPGALAVGTPDQIVEKILYQHELFGHDRYLMQMDHGAVPHEKVMHSIELFATKVAPAVREALAEKAPATP
jgi:alkanesulfonate monooxygenase SsuD/methylene tetrahydromethanopterin reductase-like flavin-dependent oxidoreductase (luciferase family)